MVSKHPKCEIEILVKWQVEQQGAGKSKSMPHWYYKKKKTNNTEALTTICLRLQ